MWRYSTLGMPSILSLLCKILSHTDLIIIYIALGAHTQLDMKRQMQQNYCLSAANTESDFSIESQFCNRFYN